MRVLLFSQWFQPEPMMKGLPFAKELARRGHQVEVLTGFPNYPGGQVYPGYHIRPWQREIMDGLRINRVALYPSHDQSGLRRMINYLSFALMSFLLAPWLVRKADVIYVYNLITLGPTAFLLRLLFGAKIILDVQDLWPESVINSGMLGNGAAHRLLTAICNWIYRHVDWVVVLSPGFKQALIQRGVQADRIEVIYNWSDEDAQRPTSPDPELARTLGMAGHFNVLFAGTMGVMQGLDTALEAARLCQARIPEAQFVFVGGGVDRERLAARAADMQLANVLFLPRQAPEAMGAIYALADVVLVHLKDDPLFRITIPSKTQTCMYMSKPVIMAVSGDAADLVEQAHAGLTCPPDNPQALVETVMKLAAMSIDDRERLGRNGADFYRQRLSMQAGINAFEQRMQALVAGAA